MIIPIHLFFNKRKEKKTNCDENLPTEFELVFVNLKQSKQIELTTILQLKWLTFQTIDTDLPISLMCNSFFCVVQII